MTTQRLATPATLSPTDRARWITMDRARLARLDAQIARATGRRRLTRQGQRERIAANLAIYEREVAG